MIFSNFACETCTKHGGNICAKCGGHGRIKTKKFVRSKWQTFTDNVIVGKYTSCIPNQFFQNVSGQEIYDESKPLDLNVCPDRPDLVRVSRDNGCRASKLKCFYKSKLRVERHFLKILPVCMVCLEVSGGVQKRVFIIGTDSVLYDPVYDFEVRSRLAQTVEMMKPDSKKTKSKWSILSSAVSKRKHTRAVTKSDSMAYGDIQLSNETNANKEMLRRFSLYK